MPRVTGRSRPSIRHFFCGISPHSSTCKQGTERGRARVSRQISVKTLRRNAENVWRAPCLSYYCIFYLQRTTRGIQCRGADVDKLLPIALSHPTSLSFSSFFLSLPSISTSTCLKKSKNLSPLITDDKRVSTTKRTVCKESSTLEGASEVTLVASLFLRASFPHPVFPRSVF